MPSRRAIPARDLSKFQTSLPGRRAGESSFWPWSLCSRESASLSSMKTSGAAERLRRAQPAGGRCWIKLPWLHGISIPFGS